MRCSVSILNLGQVLNAFTRCQDEMGLACQMAVKNGTSEGAAEILSVRRWKDVTGEAAKKTRGYLTVQRREGAEGVLEMAVHYASYLDSGTVPHEIWPKAIRGTPKSKRRPGQTVRKIDDVGTTRVMLRWYEGGGTGNPVFRRMVKHPGTTGDGSFGKGVQKCERVMLREVEEGCARAQMILDR